MLETLTISCSGRTVKALADILSDPVNNVGVRRLRKLHLCTMEDVQYAYEMDEDAIVAMLELNDVLEELHFTGEWRSRKTFFQTAAFDSRRLPSGHTIRRRVVFLSIVRSEDAASAFGGEALQRSDSFLIALILKFAKTGDAKRKVWFTDFLYDVVLPFADNE